MRSKPSVGTVTVAAVLVTLAGQAAAADAGSTDIYRNQFRESFGAPVLSKHSRGPYAYLDGSTDIWDDEFSQSFGASEYRPSSQAAYTAGSTDIWGNGFRASFGNVPSSVSTRAGSIGEAAGNTVR